MSTRRMEAPGPFRAAGLAPRSDYELKNGHSIRCLPTGGRGAASILDGGSVIRSDPKVRRAGVDAGFSPSEGDLRAPDISLVPEDAGPGWIAGVPPLAIEYADRGQDEASLREKIEDFLARGTKHVWVVRLVGVRHVEVYEPDQAPRVVGAGSYLEAPGLLANPVLVEALWDPEEADRATYLNLRERLGLPSDAEVLARGREEGREEGRQEGRQEGREEGATTALRSALLTVLTARALAPDEAARTRIEAAPRSTLERWVARAAVGASLAEILAD